MLLHEGHNLVQRPQPAVTASSRPVRAAQYLRMSTEHQQYSTENQADSIRRYAEEHGIEIVRTYSDEGKSGLNLIERPGLRNLIRDVETGNTDYNMVLVYDVSRWGRFQDSDESAYYEYLCRRAKVGVNYCAEPFENDGSLQSALIKALKRTMAAEYSRELGAKVIIGQNRLVSLGFHQGGCAGYGLRRLLIDRDRNPKGLLKPGERKSIHTDRVILVPGPDEEVKLVREIYDLFIRDRRTVRGIVAELNRRSLRNDKGEPWDEYAIARILQSPKYAGINVRNMTSIKLKQPRVRNPPELWARCDHAFTPIVSLAEFEEARARYERQRRPRTDEAYLDLLRQLLQRQGELTTELIKDAPDLPDPGLYKHRFGSIRRAYELIGYTPPKDYRYMDVRAVLHKWWKEQRASFITKLQEQGAEIECVGSSSVRINKEFTAMFVMLLCRKRGNGNLWWHIELPAREKADVTVAVRLAPDNKSILDFYILPKAEIAGRTCLTLGSPRPLDLYCFDSLEPLLRAARRTHVEEALCKQ